MLWADFLADAGDFLGRPMILIPMIVIFLALIGVMVFMRMRKKDDDE
jgi:hypothetical protein